MIEEGKAAPAFTLRSAEGDKVSLSGFAGKYVVVYFYPRADTPGCTREAQAFNKLLGKFAKLDAAVLGISKDSVETHCKFRDKYALVFPLLSDPDGSVIEKYGAWGEKNLYGKKSMGIIRSTVLVGPDGKVKRIFRKVKVDGHADVVLETIQKLRSAPHDAAARNDR
jgi:thioredoxin-dependent peroxiredoxin